MYPLDVKSGLSCFTCNKTFTKSDLIESHFKTVKHQLECKRLLESDSIKMTSLEYRKRLPDEQLCMQTTVEKKMEI